MQTLCGDHGYCTIAILVMFIDQDGAVTAMLVVVLRRDCLK